MQDKEDHQQDKENERISILLKDYELGLNHQEGNFNRIVQHLGIGFGFLGVIAAYIFTQPLSLIAAWVVPSLFIPYFAYFIYTMYRVTAALWNARHLSKRLNAIFKEKALLRFESDTPESIFFSSRRGSVKIRLIYVLLMGTSAALFISILYVSLRIVYDTSHFQGTLFVLTYSLLIIILLVTSSGFLIDLPNAFRSFLNQFPDGQPIPLDAKASLRTLPRRKVIGLIAPRTWHIFAKGYFFVFGFGTALIVRGLQFSQLQQINFLFRSKADWTFSSVPTWAICILGVIYFFTEEVLLQQAKLIWDDIRDTKRDKELLQNNRRPITTGEISISSAIQQLIVRAMLALILGYILGGFILLLIFVIILLHQAVYMFWAKPRSKKHPLLLLLVLSFNLPLRFLAGVIVIVGTQWTLAPFLLLSILFYLYSFGGLAAFWALEAEYHKRNGLNVEIRHQGPYYLKKGRFWQHFGLLTSVLLSVFILLLQLTGFNTKPAYIIWIVMGLITIGIVTIPTIYIYRYLIKLFSVIRKLKLLLSITLFSTAIFLFILSLYDNSINLLLFSFIILSLYYLTIYEGQTYDKYTFEELRRRLPLIKYFWYAYLFEPIDKLGLKQLLAITFLSADPSKLGIIKKVTTPLTK